MGIDRGMEVEVVRVVVEIDVQVIQQQKNILPLIVTME